MAYVTANAVKDYTTTAGAGNITLLGTPPTGFKQFNGSIPNGSTCHCRVVDGGNTEIGLYTFTEPSTLVRTTPIETFYNGVLDTTSPTAIPLSGNRAEVFIIVPATAIGVYETGSFTPTVYGGTSAGAPSSYSVALGTYTKIGKLVFFSIRLSWAGHTGTGAMRIGTLPFVQQANHTNAFEIMPQFITFTNKPFAYLGSSTTFLEIQQYSSAADTAAVAIDTDGSLAISGTYMTA